MCNVCGCGNHQHNDHHHHSTKILEPGRSGGGLPEERMVDLQTRIQRKNDQYVQQVRAVLAAHGLKAFNFLSSPGSGKTTLLEETIKALTHKQRCGVIEGDQQTDRDAERIRAAGAHAVQINTGKGCHLDAHMVLHGLEHLMLDAIDLVFIENVGNLICPASFALGEDKNIVLLSVTEGEDKPLKYPDAFFAADLLLISKMDLAPYVDFDIDKAIDYAKRINPKLDIYPLSSKTKEGFDKWLDWVSG